MSEQALPPIRENGWVGMWNNKATPAPPGFVFRADNFFLRDAAWVMRPGCVLLGSENGTDPEEYVGVGPELPGAVRALPHFTTLDGKQYVCAIAAGKLYVYNWGADSWTEVDFGASGVQIDPDAQPDWCVSRGRLIVTDGTNQPWMWDGEDFTVLSDAPKATGCVVYYDRVFFYPVDGDPTVFEWSEPGNPTIGYAQPPDYDNFWEFAQTDTGALRAMAALNEFLLVFKRHSATHIRGFDESNFQALAVREGLSDTEGLETQHALRIIENEVYAWAPSGPKYFEGGVRIIDLEMSGGNVNMLAELMSEIRPLDLKFTLAWWDKERRHVGWFLPLGAAGINRALVFALDTRSWWHMTLPADWAPRSVASNVVDPDGRSWVLIGLADGRVMKYGEGDTDAGEPIVYRLESAIMGRETPRVTKRLGELWLYINAHTELQRTRVGAIGDGDKLLRDALVSVRATGPRRLYRRGFNAESRQFRWYIECKEPGERFDVEAAETWMTVVGSWPNP